MFNLLVGFGPNIAIGSRVFESTDADVQKYVRPGGTLDLGRLARLPALVMPEVGSDEPQIARVGRVTDLAWVGSDLRFTFTPNPSVPPIPLDRIEAAAARLELSRWELTRTHWAVKAVDLYGVLADIEGTADVPRVLKIPTHTPRDPELVALMMPFDAASDPVHEALAEAATRAGFKCVRADDIWENPHIMDDVLSLIWRAQVVISDLSGRNANVFYETGIAHTLGRHVLQITQTMHDVPFDLRAIRTLTYLNNREGRGKLTDDVAAKLDTLHA